MRSDPVSVLTLLGGVARTSELAAGGVDASAVRSAVRIGRVLRLRKGVYALSALDPDRSHAAGHGGALTCVSVVRAHGLWVLDYEPDALHIEVGGHAHSRRDDGCHCVSHWVRASPRLGDRATLSRALATMYSCQGAEALFAALESALRRRALSRAGRREVARLLPHSATWLVDFARADADSGIESLVRLRLHRLGIRVRTQVDIPGVGVVDFVIGDRLILEIDGKGNHEAAPRRHRDLVRDAVAAALGFETLRFDYALVIHDWALVSDAVRSRLEIGAHESDAGRRFRAS